MRRLGLQGPVALHGVPHIFDLLRVQRVVHQLEVVFGADFVEDEETDVESTGLHVVAFAVDVEVHAAHDDLKRVRVDLSEVGAEVGEDAREHLDGYFCNLHVLVNAHLCHDYIDSLVLSIVLQ